jgi:hypothetical protein
VTKESESMEAQQVGEVAARAPERRSGLAALAAAGIAGPVMFAVVALVHSLLRSDHSLVVLPISALAAGLSGWVQDVNFLVFGSLMIAYEIGLHLGVRPTRWGVVGLAFLVLSGVGLLWAGVFPATDATGAFQDDRVLHILAFPIPTAALDLTTMSTSSFSCSYGRILIPLRSPPGVVRPRSGAATPEPSAS